MLTELGTRQFFSFATMKNLTNFSNLFVPLIWESIGYFTFADASWWSWNWDSSLWSQWEETQAWTCSCLGASHTPPHTDVHCTLYSTKQGLPTFLGKCVNCFWMALWGEITTVTRPTQERWWSFAWHWLVILQKHILFCVSLPKNACHLFGL